MKLLHTLQQYFFAVYHGNAQREKEEQK